MMQDRVARSARFCAHAHRNRSRTGKPQVRRATGDPYERHPGRVASMILIYDGADGLAFEEHHVAAGWLHDVLEDTTVTYDELVAEFGKETADVVLSLTNQFTSEACPGVNRTLRKRREIERLAAIPKENRAIKIFDRFDNVRELEPGEDFSRLYLRESEDLLVNLRKDLPTVGAMLAAEIARVGLIVLSTAHSPRGRA